MDSALELFQRVKIDVESRDRRQRNKLEKLEFQVQQQKQTIHDYQLLLQKLRKRVYKKEKKTAKWKLKCKELVRNMPIKIEKKTISTTEVIDLIDEDTIDEIDYSVIESKECEEDEVVEEEEVEVVEETEEEEEEVEVVEETEEEEEEVVEETEEEEEEEVFMVTIKGKNYFTTNETNGTIYEALEDDDIGDEVGEYKDGKPVFNKK